MYTVFALSQEKKLASQFNFTYRYIDDVFKVESVSYGVIV